MADDPSTDGKPNNGRTAWALRGLLVLFAALAAAFLLDLWGHSVPLGPLALVDASFLDTATVRRSYANLVKAKEDLSDFDCYACHEKNKPPVLRYDKDQNLVIPQEHADIVMGHGSHGRNNNCFNCHNETNLELLQTRDGRPLKFADSTSLCGSCHGPTYRDWEVGAHGRISGYWNRSLGAVTRQDCVNCHNPHSPKFPGRKPAPGPHLLREPVQASAGAANGH
jgi:formate-dependent nitrite reductase cytochrome c552 subunit